MIVQERMIQIRERRPDDRGRRDGQLRDRRQPRRSACESEVTFALKASEVGVTKEKRPGFLPAVRRQTKEDAIKPRQ
jgi:hypothetical protein